jgi:nitrate reductase alpha subunit
MPHWKIYCLRRRLNQSKGGLMKKVLIACILTVLTTTGCIIREGHGWHHWHGELKVRPAEAVAVITPATVVTSPTVNAPPPELVVAAR